MSDVGESLSPWFSAEEAVAEQVIAAVTNGEMRLNASVQDRPLSSYEKELKERYLRLNGGFLKLSSAGADLLERVKEIADSLKQQMSQHGLTSGEFVVTAEETIRSIGLEYENVLDWFLDEGLRTENNLWVALNHRSSLHSSKLIMILLDTTIKNSSWTYSVLEARIASLKDFDESVLTAPIIIHLTEAYNLKVVCLRGAIVRATGRRFLFPTEWSSKQWSAKLSQYLEIHGVSVAHSRDFAVASSLPIAYQLSVKALQNAVPNEDFEPTESQHQKVQHFWDKFLQFVDNTERDDVNRKLEAIQNQHVRYMARPKPAKFK